MIPATIAAKLLQWMRFEPVTFILLSLMSAVWRLIFMSFSPLSLMQLNLHRTVVAAAVSGA
jgi:hypothetical protein